VEKNIELFKKISLFKGMEENEIIQLINCLGAIKKKYSKNTQIFESGIKNIHVGILISGEVHIVEEDVYGNQNIFFRLHQGDIFGEVFTLINIINSATIPVAITECEVLLIDKNSILTPCNKICSSHIKLIENLLYNVANKAFDLHSKVLILSKRTTRDKLLTFLSCKSRESGDQLFSISFNRQQLADFLCVDRSALSVELSKLKKEGILDYHKNTFRINTDIIDNASIRC